MARVLPAHRTDLMASRAAAPRAGQWIRGVLAGELSISDRASIDDVVFAVHETLLNIVEHAYPTGDDGIITVTVDRRDDVVVVQVFDDGAEFDPRRVTPSESRNDGRTGLQAVGSLMDEVVYEHTPDGNRWRLSKVVNR